MAIKSKQKHSPLFSLQDWHKELIALAKRKNMAWLVHDLPEAHEEGYLAGDSPEEELQTQIEHAY